MSAVRPFFRVIGVRQIGARRAGMESAGREAGRGKRGRSAEKSAASLKDIKTDEYLCAPSRLKLGWNVLPGMRLVGQH